MSKDFVIKGGKELDAALKKLPFDIEKKILRAAMRQGANVIKDDAKQRVPVNSGALKRSIRVSTDGRRGQVTAKVKAGNKKAWWYNFVEFGTGIHWIKAKRGGVLSFIAGDGKSVKTKKVLHTGARAKPFMRPALDSKSGDAINKVASEIRRRLQEVVKPAK